MESEITGDITRVVDLFARSTSKIVLPDETTITTADVIDGGRRGASALTKLGCRAGDRIAVRLPNGRAYLEALVACAVGRLVLVSVNTRYSESEAHDLITRSGARIVIDDSQPLPMSDSSEITNDPNGVAIPEDPFVVFTTSGTTNKPKMVRHHQRSIATHGYNAARAFRYGADDVVLVVMPFCGTFGLSSLTAALAANAAVIVADRFDADHVADVIARHRVTVVNGSDDMFHRLIENGADISTIRLGGYARFNSSLDGIVARAQSCGATLMGLYGMSEVQALFALRDPSLPAPERERAGGTMVAPDARCRVVDEELQLQGPSLFEGYLAEGGAEIDADLTARAFENGWFRTGDAASIDADTAFTYHTRLGDVLRLGGFLVAPAEIESVLCELDEISEAQVVEVDRPTGARPVAFVIPSAAQTPIDESAVIAHCGTRLARYKVPVRVVAVDEFPMTPSANGNKIQRVKLRAMAESLLE